MYSPLLFLHTHPTFFFFSFLEDYYVMLMKNAQIPAHHPAPPVHPAVSQVKGSSLDSERVLKMYLLSLASRMFWVELTSSLGEITK